MKKLKLIINSAIFTLSFLGSLSVIAAEQLDLNSYLNLSANPTYKSLKVLCTQGTPTKITFNDHTLPLSSNHILLKTFKKLEEHYGEDAVPEDINALHRPSSAIMASYHQLISEFIGQGAINITLKK